MNKTAYYFLIVSLLVLLTACDNTNDFKGIEEAIKLNKLNITSIEVEATRTKTVEVSTLSCDTNPCNTFLPTHKTEPFKAYGFTSENKRLDITSDVEWSTSDATKAQINQNGSLTTQAVVGDVDVIATLGSAVGKTTVSVSSATLADTGIYFINGVDDITGTTPVVVACDTYPLTILGLFSDNSKRDITYNMSWSVEEAATPTQDAKVVLNDTNQGVFSSHTVPTVPYVVKASYTDEVNNSIQKSLDINVDEPAAGSTMSIDPASPTVATSATSQLTALITNNSVSKDVTSTAKWDTDDSSKATVSTAGLVTGVAIGSAAITASCGSISKSATVTVANKSDVAYLTIKDENNALVLSTVELTLSDATKKTKDLSVIVTYFDKSTADITADLDINAITIVSLDTDTSLPVSKSIVAVGGLSSTSILRITALRVGTAMMTVNYSGLVFYQYIRVN